MLAGLADVEGICHTAPNTSGALCATYPVIAALYGPAPALLRGRHVLRTLGVALDLGVDVAARLVDADAVLAAAHAVTHDAVVEDAGAGVEAAGHDLALDVLVVVVILHTVS